jgi:hypothetical protein
MVQSFQEALKKLSVKNVFIYVGDAVRWDAPTLSVRDRGTTLPTVAASIHSPTSFASIATGLHPPNHGVYSFSSRISEEVPRLFDIPGVKTGFRNSIQDTDERVDPIFSVLGINSEESPPNLNDISQPFLLVERGPGGHAPYGDSHKSAGKYFRSRRGADTAMIRDEYEQSIAQDVLLFEARLETLNDRDLLEDTLVIYTSDHGELLGEGGILGHNGPMRPELVRVPTTFIHPDLPRKQFDDFIARHVDILPTVIDILDTNFSGIQSDGRSLSQEFPEWGQTFYDSQFFSSTIPMVTGNLAYSGVWDTDGGYVFAETSTINRLSILAGKLLRSPKRSYLRRHLPAATKSYAATETSYGSPSFARSEAKTIIEQVRSGGVARQQVELDAEAEDHLEDLGYM